MADAITNGNIFDLSIYMKLIEGARMFKVLGNNSADNAACKAVHYSNKPMSLVLVSKRLGKGFYLFFSLYLHQNKLFFGRGSQFQNKGLFPFLCRSTRQL